MAGRCGCDPQSVAACQCSTEDTDTINQTGAGLAGDPFSWDVIVDPISGNILEDSAAGLRVLVPDDVADPPHATMVMASLYAHTSGTGAGGAEAIPFDSVSEDNRSHWNGAGGLDIVVPGFYEIALMVYWSGTVGLPKIGRRHSRIAVDGVDTEVGSCSTNDANDTWSHAVGGSRFKRLAGGQTVTGIAIQNSGGDLRYANGLNGTVLSILRVGD